MDRRRDKGDIEITKVGPRKYEVVRPADSAAGYRMIEASNVGLINQAVTLLQQEERRALAVERIKVKFGEI